MENPTAEDPFTDEHVFPAALGGVLTVAHGVCAACNNGFSKIEQALAKELTPIRLLLQIPDRYGNVPHTDATIKTEKQVYLGRVRGDGSVQPKPIITEETGAAGTREFVHRFATERQKEKLRKLAQEKGQELIEMGPGEPVTAEVHIGGDLMTIGSAEGLRTAAKIAYVGFAYTAGARVAASDPFSEVRTYISEGKGAGISRLFINERFLSLCQQGPHQHSIIIAARRDQHRADAIVRLFGGLCYFVVLSDRYNGADFNCTLAYDAHRGEINGLLLAHEQAEFLQTEDVRTSKDTVWGNLEASGRAFCQFLEQAIKAKLAKDRGRREEVGGRPR